MNQTDGSKDQTSPIEGQDYVNQGAKKQPLYVYSIQMQTMQNFKVLCAFQEDRSVQKN